MVSMWLFFARCFLIWVGMRRTTGSLMIFFQILNLYPKKNMNSLFSIIKLILSVGFVLGGVYEVNWKFLAIVMDSFEYWFMVANENFLLTLIELENDFWVWYLTYTNLCSIFIKRNETLIRKDFQRIWIWETFHTWAIHWKHLNCIYKWSFVETVRKTQTFFNRPVHAQEQPKILVL